MIGLIDIGGTKMLAAVTQPDGSIGPVLRRPTPATDPVVTLTAMLDEARGASPLEAIAIAVPGPFTRTPAALLNPPSMTPPWWNLNFAVELGERYGCAVLAENDANCAALAEAVQGAAVGHGTVVYITVSTGVGTGIVRNGRLIYGEQDTEGGHMVLWPSWLGGPPCDCGGHGCLETLVSGRGLRARFGAQAHEIDDREIWEEVGRWLGIAVTNLTATLNPDVIVFGGGVCHAWARFWPAMDRTITETLHLVPRPHIRRASLGEDRNLYGALLLIK